MLQKNYYLKVIQHVSGQNPPMQTLTFITGHKIKMCVGVLTCLNGILLTHFHQL